VHDEVAHLPLRPGLVLDGMGWRLPTVLELSSLVDETRTGTSIDPLFTPTDRGRYWSASPVASSARDGWSVTFNGGSVYSNFRTNSGRARCVR
jgi:hypothetical protein